METKWLEDFLCLAETRNFARAASDRHITQSAFSRRIMALEEWLGVNLVDRSLHPATLTSAGCCSADSPPTCCATPTLRAHWCAAISRWPTIQRLSSSRWRTP